MGQIKRVKMLPATVNPVKYFVGALYSSEQLLKKAITQLIQQFSPIDLESDVFGFTVTDYYNSEMGTPIFRKFYSFEKIEKPDFVTDFKLISNGIELDLAIAGKRKVNLDVGYLDYDKIVLASAKYGIHKIYLDQGIYADLALHYEKGNFTPYPWAFMDFRSKEYYPFFMKMRGIYKRQLKSILNPN
jgi:hypothetical protein